MKIEVESKLSELKNLRANLGGNSFHTKKGLGQNFLVNESIALEIIDGANIDKDDIVLEIGPGVGSLTRYLLPRAKQVVAVELDKNAIPLLKNNTKEFDNLNIINDDILKVDLHKIFETNEKIKVVANLPYYITSPIIMYLLENDFGMESITVMVQKEVGMRILADPGTKSYGVLTLAVKYYAEASLVTNVGKENFFPIPKVDSVVIKLILKNKSELLSKEDELKFFQLIKSGFGMRRKNMLNSFAGIFGGDKEAVKEFLDKGNIDGKRRAETLSIEEYFKLTKLRSE
ncbi:MAG: 16S rRNA (adenine(1518)-N(6)/adenine(1519)-N(6))-dimethyltransferase RsmA [Firmicutes bacterium]|nr:16S rRNA (adenine(1518)-N(6)/adenine(1519)-N(6))-dimethyltransferase RsmA [Bacillota bacterium]